MSGDDWRGPAGAEDDSGADEGRGPARRKRAQAAIVADRLLETHRFARDNAGNLYIYDGACWRPIERFELEAMIWQTDAKALTARQRGEIASLLGVMVHESDFAFGRVADSEIAFADGVLDVASGRLRPHRPEDRLETVLPWGWDDEAQAPRWRQALGEFFDDPEDGRHDALQEFFGYICLTPNRFKKALLLLGPGDTGKSLIIDVAAAMVGERQVATLALEFMNDPVKRAVIKGKRLNVATEVSQQALLADDGFKALVAGDPVLVERKFMMGETYRPMAKHVISANSVPKIRGRALEVFARFLVVPMTRVFQEAEKDTGLAATIVAEMPGILAWAVEGAKRLIGNEGRFTVVKPAAAALADIDARRNPMIDFMNEQMEADDGGFVACEVLAVKLTERSRRNVSSRQVGGWLRELGYEVKEKKLKGSKRVVACLLGWRWVGQAGALGFSDFEGEPDDELAGPP